MSKIYNLARMTTSTVGTGTITLGSAVPSFLTFAQSGVSDGETVSYGIEDGAHREVGRGVWTAAGGTLTRSVLRSTNSNSPISLTGSAQVFITIVAEDVVTPAASKVQAEARIDNATVMTPLRTLQSIIATDHGLRNIVGRNGGLEVWERGGSIAVGASSTGSYTADGFYLVTGANQAATVSRQGGLVVGSRFSARVQRNSGQTGTGVMRWAIPLDSDEVYKLQGKCAVISFVVSTGANWSPISGTLNCTLYIGGGAPAKRSGSAYSGESAPITAAFALSQGAAAAQKITGISAPISGSATQAELQFNWTPQGTAGTNDWFSVDDLQLELVPVNTPEVTPVFERTDYLMDLMRCRRFAHYFASLRCSASYVTYLIPFSPIVPQMRTTPTLAINSQGTSTVTRTDGGSSHSFANASGNPSDAETWANITFVGLSPNFDQYGTYSMTNVFLSADI